MKIPALPPRSRKCRSAGPRLELTRLKLTLLGLRLQRCKHNSLLGDDHTFRIILVVGMLIHAGRYLPAGAVRRLRARRSIAEEGAHLAAYRHRSDGRHHHIRH
jgi:hypothetical protein